jgi:hypothetical protein
LASITSTYKYEGPYSANSTATPSGQNWLSGWDKHVKFTVDADDVDEELTDVLVYVHVCGLASGQYDENVMDRDGKTIKTQKQI